MATVCPSRPLGWPVEMRPTPTHGPVPGSTPSSARSAPLDALRRPHPIGGNDPDGYRQEPEQLLAALDRRRPRRRVPDARAGRLRTANDTALATGAAHPDRLVAFCRVNPHDGPLPEARRALDAGARGIKLHPRAEQLRDGGAGGGRARGPGGRAARADADPRRARHPRAGRADRAARGAHPSATLILAHAAISDLAWLWRVLPRIRTC